jgi:N6-adenosine-specific RNA methylase IME4
MCAAKAVKIYKKEAKKRQLAGVTAQGREGGTAAKKAAEDFGTRERTVERAIFVIENSPKLAAQVEAGKKTLKAAEREIKKKEQIKQIESYREPTGKYHVIVVDPPWAYHNRASDPTHRAANPYPSMSIDEIMAMPVPEICEEDCILWLWTTNSFIVQAHQIAETWGFTTKTILTWAKDRMGVGDWLRGQTEHCLMAIKGKPVINLTNQTTLLNGPMREHSRKPDEFYALVNSLCPGQKCELFSREERDGWHNFGAEIEKFGREIQ